MRLALFAPTLIGFLLLAPSAQAQLRGHGGSIRAIAVSGDGQILISGGFDQTVIRWSLQRNAAEQVLRFHEGAVNAIVMLPGGRFATAGEDGKIALWSPRQDEPDRVFEGHRGPVSALALSPDARTLASASWDRTVRLWPLGEGSPRVLEGHQDNVNGLAFAPDGRSIISAGYDATLRIWPLDGGAPLIAIAPSPLNAVAVGKGGEVVTGGADGYVRFFSPKAEPRGEVEAAPTPIVALALSHNGALVAAASIRGSVAIIEHSEQRLARTLVGPGLPVWSAVFLSDDRTLVTGGADRLIRRWDAETGEPLGSLTMNEANDPLAAYAGDRGAEVFRACIACHTLSPDEGNRAGPTLHRIFGRKIATLPGYRFSEALQQMHIIWTPETVTKLFEIGPSAYTPGTKMPEQRITSAADREALVKFLEKATR